MFMDSILLLIIKKSIASSVFFSYVANQNEGIDWISTVY